VRHDPDEAVGVPGIRCEDDATPELVDSDGPNPVVLAPSELFQVEPGVDMLGELVNRCLNAALNGLRQLGVVVQKVLVDRKPRHVKRLPSRFPP
jgi:hypothetical protein